MISCNYLTTALIEEERSWVVRWCLYAASGLSGVNGMEYGGLEYWNYLNCYETLLF